MKNVDALAEMLKPYDARMMPILSHQLSGKPSCDRRCRMLQAGGTRGASTGPVVLQRTNHATACEHLPETSGLAMAPRAFETQPEGPCYLGRMRRLINRWLPPPRIGHPYPLRRLGVIT
jgi:hypothetical protein